MQQVHIHVLPSPEVYAAPATPPITTPKRSRSRLIAGIATLCGLVCVAIGIVVIYESTHNHATAIKSFLQQPDAAPFQVKVTLKRTSMHFNGQNEATIHVKPRASTGSNFEFDATMSLDSIDGAIETYSYINGAAYWSLSKDGVVQQSKCLDASQIPPIDVMESSLVNSRVIDTVSIGTESTMSTADCDGGKLLHVTFAGESFAFCTSASKNQLTKAKGNDIDLEIIYPSSNDLKQRSSILPIDIIDIPMNVDTNQPLECPVLFDVSLPARPASWLPSTEDMANVLTRTPRQLKLFGSSCGGCRSERKPCLFVHGVGYPFAGPLADTFPLYWGNVHEHMPCCSSIKFARFDTVNNGWNSPKLQQDFCNAALTISGSTTKEVGKLILVTHSMGNLVTGAAVANGKCSLSKDVTWIGSAGPLSGSKAANLLYRKCTEGGWSSVIKDPLTLIGFCPPTSAFASLYYQSTVDSVRQNEYLAAQAVRRDHVTKMICGVSPQGLNSIFSAPMSVVGAWAGHEKDNDGMVELTSCTVGLGSRDGFGSDTSSYHYLGKLNHVDLTFREGDGWWGSDRKPVKWLECAL